MKHGRSASSHRPALTLARCSVAAHCALLRVLATPALRASDVRKLTRGAPCFTGLIGSYCTLNSQWSSCCALRLAVLPCLLGLLRPVSRTARGLRAPHWLRRLFRPHWAYSALLRSTIRNSRLATLPLASLLCSLDFRFACFAHCARRSSVPQGARFVRPSRLQPLRGLRLCTALRSVCSPLQPFGPPMFASSLAAFFALLGLLRPVSATGGGLRAPLFPSGKRRLWDRATSYGSATSQKAPLSQRGAGGGAD